MKIKIHNPIIGILFFISNAIYSQVTTIDYLSAGLSTTDCNVFSPSSTVIGGVLHSSWAGGVEYATNSGIELSTTFSTNSAGTAFFINYDFMPNHRYTISITAEGNGQNVYLAASVLNSFNSYPSSGSSSCSTDPNVSIYPHVGIANFSTYLSTTFSTYTFSFNITGSTTYQYLLIWANEGNLSLNTASISKIEITAQSFNITPSTVSYACGTTLPQTFEINNPNGIPSVTQYIWNLGTNNNWLYNGSPAAATISTGTIPTITLTPKCGKKQSNVYATITAGGIDFLTTNTASISISQPSLSINGESSICNGSTSYTINGLVCKSKITWTQPPQGFGTLNNTTTSTTTYTTGTSNGNFTLTSNVKSCDVTQTVTKNIHVGSYLSTDYIFNGNNGSNYWCPNNNYTFGVGPNEGVPAATNFVWTVPTGWTTIYIGSTYIVIRSPSGTTPATGSLSVTFNEPCGAQLNKNFFLAYNATSCSGKKAFFSISPNPASSSILVKFDDFSLENNKGKIQITDLLGNIKSTLNLINNKPIKISVLELMNGNYIIKLFDGTFWHAEHLIVQH